MGFAELQDHHEGGNEIEMAQCSDELITFLSPIVRIEPIASPNASRPLTSTQFVTIGQCDSNNRVTNANCNITCGAIAESKLVPSVAADNPERQTQSNEGNQTLVAATGIEFFLGEEEIDLECPTQLSNSILYNSLEDIELWWKYEWTGHEPLNLRPMERFCQDNNRYSDLLCTGLRIVNTQTRRTEPDGNDRVASTTATEHTLSSNTCIPSESSIEDWQQVPDEQLSRTVSLYFRHDKPSRTS